VIYVDSVSITNTRLNPSVFPFDTPHGLDTPSTEQPDGPAHVAEQRLATITNVAAGLSWLGPEPTETWPAIRGMRRLRHEPARPLTPFAFRSLALCAVCSPRSCKTPTTVALSKQDSGSHPKVAGTVRERAQARLDRRQHAVFERPAANSARLGYLHAGGRVARRTAVFQSGCATAGIGAPCRLRLRERQRTVDLRHPTLARWQSNRSSISRCRSRTRE
jgi:hypothetical protein